MIRYGIVSYNMYCNFTNYGSALQSWALYKTINRIGNGKWTSVLVDYCPDQLMDKNPLHPYKNMWDTDKESLKLCKLSMPAIHKNYEKFNNFYTEQFEWTKQKYTSSNFNDIISTENINGFICGSDTIFCIDEFNGFDDGYYANYKCMKNGYTVSYAASFGDARFDNEKLGVLNNRLKNFKYIGLRENFMINYVKMNTSVRVERNVDPTLLLTSKDYDNIASPRLVEDKYLLLYARRYNRSMELLADQIAEKNGWKVVEISLRATNSNKHIMRYDAGVEEFLSLVRNAEYILTNSYHGLIFAVQYRRPFYVFSRESGESKINEVLELFGLKQRLVKEGHICSHETINYDEVHERIKRARDQSLKFLNESLEGYNK